MRRDCIAHHHHHPTLTDWVQAQQFTDAPRHQRGKHQTRAIDEVHVVCARGGCVEGLCLQPVVVLLFAKQVQGDVLQPFCVAGRS